MSIASRKSTRMKWTRDDIHQCLMLVRQGKTYAEISDEMGRSQEAIAKFVGKMRKLDPSAWRRIAKKTDPPQLCWSCQYASRPRKDGWICPWAKNLTPVEGWTATIVQKEQYYFGNIKEVVTTYSITECPEFKEG